MIIPASLEQKSTNMRKLILLTLMIAALASFKTSTTRHITGIVFGNDDKLPIIGATVKVQGTHIGVVTNQKGAYAIDVPEGKTNLIFSYIGYQTKNVTIGKADTLNVYLDASASTLNEVVVTGYQTQAKKDATGSVVVIGSSDIQVAAPSSSQYLQGQAAGVTVYKSRVAENKKIG